MAKPGVNKKRLSSGMLTLAATAGWAAAHEPPQFSTASVGVWLCGAVTMALLTRAGLALVTPLLTICGVIFGRALKVMQHHGADS
jgi:hypothetical protein